jgi:integrase
VTVKLTKHAVEHTPAPHPSGKQAIFFDSELRGFGLLVSGTTTGKTYFAQHRKPGDKGPRRVNLGPVSGYKTVEEARLRAAETIRMIRDGRDPLRERRQAAMQHLTLAEALDHYTDTIKDLEPKTIKMYRNHVNRHLADWRDRPLRDITPTMVAERHSRIGKAHPATANGMVRTVRAVYNLALRRDPTLPPNPALLGKRQLYNVEPRTDFVRAEHLPGFVRGVRALPNPVARDYLLAVLLTGMRREEMSCLQWSEVDLAMGVIRLPASRTKSGRPFDVPITRQLREVLMARRASGSTSKWVFPSHKSRLGHIVEPKGMVVDACALGEVPPVMIHGLRRTWSTYAEAADISFTALKALMSHSLNHSSLGVTGGYIQMGLERLREPAQRVADKIAELSEWGEPGGDNVERLA